MKRNKRDTLQFAKMKAAMMFATENLSTREIAIKVGQSTRMVNTWLDDPAFQDEVRRYAERFLKVNEEGKEFRKQQASTVLPFLYNELFRRVAVDPACLEHMRDTDLRQLIIGLQHEARLDTDGDVTQKVGHLSTNKLADRYNKSCSGKKMKKEKRVSNLDDHRKK